MGKEKKTLVFHVGKRPFESAILFEKFTYKWLPEDYDFIYDQLLLEIIKDGEFNSKFGRAVFVFSKDAKVLHDQKNLLVKFPAHQIIYDKTAKVGADIKKILDLKEAKPLDFSQKDVVFLYINEQYNSRQEGYKLPGGYFKVYNNFKGEVNRQGNTYTELTGDFGDELQQLASWKMTTVVFSDSVFESYPEFEIVSGDVSLVYKFFILNNNGTDIIKVIEATDKEIKKTKRVIIESRELNGLLNVSVYAKGKNGKIRIGPLHIRRALSPGSIMIPGGKRIIDEENLNGELIYYFNPGDFKPPLAVYFSGYRSAEGFEGRRMMTSMDCPFMLIGDPRLEGGNFYRGSEKLEQQLVKIIKEKLDLLGFDKSELVLSGLSMGTFGSLYYAADLEPCAVIVGKPLVNMGDIALNQKINRPDVFDTSLDMLFYETRGMTEEHARKLNKEFWDKFRTGDYTNTTFAFSYMKQDDYDKEAFPKLFEVIKEKNPRTRVLYKGFIGRHNDNSPGVNGWFLKQYRNIMVNRFHRKPSDFK
ncbi:accessory Sec system protein Asp2 [Enterococcus sp. AZ103]|uniref:accessory Sec system protein Asp2 n=1 Tax=Enterococcus sp. AZ103 TaxID=2774628 RepID=UPI003F220E0D